MTDRVQGDQIQPCTCLRLFLPVNMRFGQVGESVTNEGEKMLGRERGRGREREKVNGNRCFAKREK